MAIILVPSDKGFIHRKHDLPSNMFNLAKSCIIDKIPTSMIMVEFYYGRLKTNMLFAFPYISIFFQRSWSQ